MYVFIFKTKTAFFHSGPKMEPFPYITNGHCLYFETFLISELQDVENLPLFRLLNMETTHFLTTRYEYIPISGLKSGNKRDSSEENSYEKLMENAIFVLKN